MSNEHALPPPLKRAEDDINLYSNVHILSYQQTYQTYYLQEGLRNTALKKCKKLFKK